MKVHNHVDNEFQGKTPQQIEDSFRWAKYCLIALTILSFGLFINYLIQL